MKKSILALGAAVAVGGFGFAGAAHAVAYFGPGATFTHTSAGAATVLEQNVGGTGHMLYAPYYSTQGDTGTLLNITNTDTVNGKAVKVRFRGAANSDDVLDFTVLLSPGDVWTASLAKDPATGLPVLTTQDNSCTLPAIPAAGQPFNPGRLPNYLSEDARVNHTREGYVEFLNMADIPNVAAPGLFKSIKHGSNGKPADCNSAAVSNLITTNVLNAADAEGAGLFAPTGGLMGSWAVMNQTKLAVYGGAMTAVQARVAAGGANAYGNIIFSPQNDGQIGAAVTVNTLTADPLLNTTAASYLEPLWYDLPDMSTPLVAGATPNAQVLGMDLNHGAVVNDYVADANGQVPMMTDWVVSQPTRRYYAAVDYSTSASAAKIVYNADMTAAAGALANTTTAPAAAVNPYGVLRLNQVGDMGPYACISASVGTTDREESTIAQGATFSPGVSTRLCGEVFVVSFGGSSVLNAGVSNVQLANPAGKAGWGRLTLANSAALPIVGFGATSIQGQTGNYGLTLPYRW